MSAGENGRATEPASDDAAPASDAIRRRADEIRAHLDPIRHEFAQSRSLVLPALKYAQGRTGHLTPDDLVAVAAATDLSPAYVESVASFYDRLYLHPVGKRVVSVCITLSCMLRGSDELLEALCAHEDIVLDHGQGTSADDQITIQEAQCLGACDRAPCLQVDAERAQGPMRADEAGTLLDDLRAAPAPTPIRR